MMQQSWTFLGWLLICFVLRAADVRGQNYASDTLPTVEYSVDGDQFLPLGSLEFEILDEEQSSPILDIKAHNTELHNSLQTLADSSGLLTVRVGQGDNGYATASLRGPCLARPPQAMILSLGASKQLAGIQLIPRACGDAAAAGSSADSDASPSWSTVTSIPVHYHHAHRAEGVAVVQDEANKQAVFKVAQPPPGADTTGGKQQDGKQEGKQEVKPDDRPWWQKNWFFFAAAALVIFNQVMKGAAGEQQGPGRAGTGR